MHSIKGRAIVPFSAPTPARVRTTRTCSSSHSLKFHMNAPRALLRPPALLGRFLVCFLNAGPEAVARLGQSLAEARVHEVGGCVVLHEGQQLPLVDLPARDLRRVQRVFKGSSCL
jgi:hypothetical protein